MILNIIVFLGTISVAILFFMFFTYLRMRSNIDRVKKDLREIRRNSSIKEENIKTGEKNDRDV